MIKPATSSPARRVPVYGLDAARFLAAGLVVAYHLGFKAVAIEGSALNLVLGDLVPYPPGWWLTWCGWIGVQVFFVISGAVIAYSASGASARDFAVRRIARLLPALLIAVAIAVPVAIFAFAMPAGKAAWLGLKTLLFAPWGPWIIGQFWTIPIELCFYALVCLLLAADRSGRRIEALAWVLGLASAGYWLAVALGMLVPGGRLAELLLLQHGIYFAIGMMCAQLGTRKLTPRQWALVLVCVGTAALQVRETAAWEMAGRADLAARWPLAYAIWSAITVLVALSFFYRDAIAARVAGCAGLLRLAGISTYPLYLLHIHVGGGILLVAAPLGHMPAFLAAFFGSLLAALAIAVWLEPPLHKACLGILDTAARRAQAWRDAPSR